MHLNLPHFNFTQKSSTWLSLLISFSLLLFNSGKSTSAQLLARKHGYVFYEGDCFFTLRYKFSIMIFDASSLNFKIESVQNVGQTYHQTNTQGSHFWSVVWICLKLINYKGGDVSDGPMFLINLVPIGNPYLFFLINLILIRNPYIPVDSKDPSMDQLKQRKLVCSFRFEIFQLRTFAETYFQKYYILAPVFIKIHLITLIRKRMQNAYLQKD